MKKSIVLPVVLALAGIAGAAPTPKQTPANPQEVKVAEEKPAGTIRLEKTRALIASLAKAVGIAAIPQDSTGGYHLTIGAADDIYIYGGDDQQILMVVPVAKLPLRPDYALTNWLLRSNLFDSKWAPFQIAADEGGMVVLWGKLKIADLDGLKLATIIDNIADRATEMRKELAKYPDVVRSKR